MAKTYEEINEKIKKGKAVVVTAEEMIGIVKDQGREGRGQDVDVVTTGTFGPMCSSGAFINIGHTKPRIKIGKATIEGVPVFCGLAAVDCISARPSPPRTTRSTASFRASSSTAAAT